MNDNALGSIDDDITIWIQKSPEHPSEAFLGNCNVTLS